MMDFVQTVILGAYIFSAGSYAFAWASFRWLSGQINDLRTLITNHQAHRFEDIEKRLTLLEDHGRKTSATHPE